MYICVFGSGPLKHALKIYAQKNGIDAEFKGHVGNEEVLRYVKSSAALVIPSLWPEPLGRIHLEGLGVGACILSTATGGSPEIIQHQKNGLLFETVEQLTTSLKQVLGDAVFAQSLKKNAKKSSEHYHYDNICKRILREYRGAEGLNTVTKSVHL